MFALVAGTCRRRSLAQMLAKIFCMYTSHRHSSGQVAFLPDRYDQLDVAYSNVALVNCKQNTFAAAVLELHLLNEDAEKVEK